MAIRPPLQQRSRRAWARILDAADTDEVRRLIRKKYGISGRLTVWLSKVRGGSAGSGGIEITID